MTRNYELVYYVAENVGIIGILAYPKIDIANQCCGDELYIYKVHRFIQIQRSQLYSNGLVESKMANIERKFMLWDIINYCLSLFSVFPSFKYLSQISVV